MFEQKLVQNLESQVEMHQVMLDVLNQENVLPASCTLLELEEIHSVRDLTAGRISELESSRIQLVGNFKRKRGISEDISLKQLIDECRPELQETFISLRIRLKELTRDIRKIGKKNAETAMARVACFNELQDAVQKSFKRYSVYAGNGMLAKPKGAYLDRSIMLQKSI
ncbi:MAG: flagellar protein FlgN [Proteobacteria bacterium]|nr:flagellar protein FlgN [Pseudomonadota bacterium]